MTKTDEMMEQAKKVRQTPAEREKQRRSFAYGNAKTENDSVTWAMIDTAAEKHPKSDRV